MSDIKRLARDMAHLMDEQRESLPPEEREELREEHARITKAVLDSGYGVDAFLSLVEEYKTLTFEQYREWIKE